MLHFANMARALGRRKVATSQFGLRALGRRVGTGMSGDEESRGKENNSGGDFHVRSWRKECDGEPLKWLWHIL